MTTVFKKNINKHYGGNQVKNNKIQRSSHSLLANPKQAENQREIKVTVFGIYCKFSNSVPVGGCMIFALASQTGLKSMYVLTCKTNDN